MRTLAVRDTDQGAEPDESQFIQRLFAPKPGVEAFIRTIHGSGDEWVC